MFRKRQKIPKKFSGMEIEDYVLTATEKEASRMERPLEKKWFDFLWWFIVAFIVILGMRVFFLIVIRGAYYQDVSKGNSVRSIVIKAPRGRIFDRAGVPLVNNVPSIDAVIIPADIPRDSVKTKEMAEDVSKILNLNIEEVWSALESNTASKSLNPVLLKEHIEHNQALALLEKSNDLPGIGIEKTAIRDYTDGPIFSHILGYEGN